MSRAVLWQAGFGALPQDEAADPSFRKDANQVLMEDGPEALRSCLEAAEPYPIRGLFRYDFGSRALPGGAWLCVFRLTVYICTCLLRAPKRWGS